MRSLYPVTPVQMAGKIARFRLTGFSQRERRACLPGAVVRGAPLATTKSWGHLSEVNTHQQSFREPRQYTRFCAQLSLLERLSGR